MKAKPDGLNFGILCDGTMFSDYAAKAIRHLLRMDNVHLQVLIIDSRNQARASSPGPVGKIDEKVSAVKEMHELMGTRRTINQISWHFYNKIRGTPACDRKVDLSEELENVPRIQCDVREKGYSEYFYPEDLKRIEEYDLDFALRRGFGIIRGEILDLPTYGVWSYHHADERKYRGSTTGFWEIHNGDPVTGAILQKLTDRLDAGIILRRGFLPTVANHRQNMNQVKYASASWPAQVATDILLGNAEYIDGSATETNAEIYYKPSIFNLARYYTNRFQSIYRRLTWGNEKWNVGIIQSPISDLIDGQEIDNIRWFIEESKNKYIADPFGIEIDGEPYVFVEEYDRSVEKGKISYVKLNGGWNKSVETALETDFHLAYPYVFKHEGREYCIPDSGDINEIRLYELITPDNWRCDKKLITNVPASDPTLITYHGRFWLFFTQAETHWPGHKTDLHIWSAPSLRGPWEPHENNPVKTDIRSARPGGVPFIKDETLYRPAQNCVGTYGSKIVINEVETLTTEEFSEKPAYELNPNADGPYPNGLHTVSAIGDATIIDGKRYVWDSHTLRGKYHDIVAKL